MPEVITDNIDLWTSALLTKSTAGRGSNGRVEAYGIKKLRELILELAVRGKLMPQEPGDEPASELLKRIQTEKDELIAAGKIKKDKPLPQINDEDKPFKLPYGWAYSNLGDVVEIVRGITFPGSEKSKVPEKGRIACLRTSNVQDQIEWEDILYIREQFVSREDQLLKPRDIVMSMANSRELVGKVALVGEKISQKTSFGGFLGVLRPFLIDPRFVMALLRTPHTRELLIDSASQTTNIANVSLAKLKPLFFAIPPLVEQHRIVAKVDELMALCDQLEQQQTNNIEAHQTLVEALLGTLTNVESQEEFTVAWTRIANHFDTLFTTEQSIGQLKQTVLQLAVIGKLVPQDPNDEPAAVLLKRICKEKEVLGSGGKSKKQNALPVIDETDRLCLLPDTWEWVRFGELIQSFTNGLYKKESFYSDAGVISLRMYNIQNGQVEFSDLRRVNVTDDELVQYALEPGDLLINRVNSKELVGKTAIIPECSETILFESMNMRAKPYKAHLDSEYLNLFMQTGMAKSILLSTAKEAISQASINQGQIASLPVPLPPKTEQHRIVAKVNELMTLCDSLNARLAAAKTTQIHLADTIVEQAVA